MMAVTVCTEYKPSLFHSIVSFNHSFIHYRNVHSASYLLLLRSAPDPCTAKENSFEARVECVRVNLGEQSLRQVKCIPHGRAKHGECTGLPCESTGKSWYHIYVCLRQSFKTVKHQVNIRFQSGAPRLRSVYSSLA